MKLGIAKLPADMTIKQMLGVSFACGIGFTMSLFIAGLAFEHSGGAYYVGDKLGILIASVLAAVSALIVLAVTLPKKETVQSASQT